MIPTCFLLITIASGALEAFKSGNDLYLAGNYQGAIAAYESAVAESSQTAEIFYNMGNAYYKLGDKPRAILYYEKSLSLSPRSMDARSNLKRAKDELTLTDEEKLLVSESFRGTPVVNRFTLDESSIIFFWAYIPFTLFLFLTVSFQGKWRQRLTAGSVLLLFITLILGFLLLMRYLDSRNKYGILLVQRIELREGPENTAPPAATSFGGLKARLSESLDAHGETWHKVELPNGQTGWVKDSSLGII